MDKRKATIITPIVGSPNTASPIDVNHWTPLGKYFTSRHIANSWHPRIKDFLTAAQESGDFPSRYVSIPCARQYYILDTPEVEKTIFNLLFQEDEFRPIKERVHFYRRFNDLNSVSLAQLMSDFNISVKYSPQIGKHLEIYSDSHPHCVARIQVAAHQYHYRIKNRAKIPLLNQLQERIPSLANSREIADSSANGLILLPPELRIYRDPENLSHIFSTKVRALVREKEVTLDLRVLVPQLEQRDLFRNYEELYRAVISDNSYSAIQTAFLNVDNPQLIGKTLVERVVHDVYASLDQPVRKLPSHVSMILDDVLGVTVNLNNYVPNPDQKGQLYVTLTQPSLRIINNNR